MKLQLSTEISTNMLVEECADSFLPHITHSISLADAIDGWICYEVVVSLTSATKGGLPGAAANTLQVAH
eukprot:1311022-Amphidinium_carterae.1